MGPLVKSIYQKLQLFILFLKIPFVFGILKGFDSISMVTYSEYERYFEYTPKERKVYFHKSNMYQNAHNGFIYND